MAPAGPSDPGRGMPPRSYRCSGRGHELFSKMWVWGALDRGIYAFVNRTSSRLAMQLRSIVDRRENELASHAKWPILGEKTQSWAKKRNPGRKNRVFGTFSERFYREGGAEFGKFSRAGK